MPPWMAMRPGPRALTAAWLDGDATPEVVVALGGPGTDLGFAVLVVFRTMGRDYDAAVIAAGFVGLGLGATPVGIANMEAVTKKHGPSVKAFLIIPLVGAFFIDIANATVIKFFAGLPIIANTPIP